jgi:hypothetical protein
VLLEDKKDIPYHHLVAGEEKVQIIVMVGAAQK